MGHRLQECLSPWELTEALSFILKHTVIGGCNTTRSYWGTDTCLILHLVYTIGFISHPYIAMSATILNELRKKQASTFFLSYYGGCVSRLCSFGCPLEKSWWENPLCVCQTFCIALLLLLLYLLNPVANFNHNKPWVRDHLNSNLPTRLIEIQG